MKRILLLLLALVMGYTALAQSAIIAPADSTAHARREARKEAFANSINDIVKSRNYIFRPITMQNVVTGNTRDIFAYYLYAGVTDNKVVLHLPVEFTSYVIDTINLDAFVEEYKTSLTDGNWRITFSFMYGTERWFAEFFISTITGQSRLALVTPKGVMRYLGTIESGATITKKKRSGAKNFMGKSNL
ncbi:MAG: hypothetical protein IKV09_05035 [Alistipes sp.]|nr:hypothetical protein [Alistipes sp.]